MAQEINYDDRVLAGYYLNQNKLKASASGGICTAIAEAIITKKGGVVFGAVYSEDFSQVEYAMASSVEQLEPMKGSKYISAKKEILIQGKYVSVFNTVIDCLESKVPVLFIGLGCDIAALSVRCINEGVDTSNLYTIDLICHGTTFDKVHADYLRWLKGKYKSKLIYFNVRYKKEGWLPPYIHAEFENGKIYEHNFYGSDYGKAFSKIARQGCYKCVFKGNNHKSDLTVGDYWGVTEEMSEYNKNGVSLIFVNGENGRQLLKLLDTDKFYLAPADMEIALKHNPMYLNNRKKDPKYDTFCKDLNRINLLFAVLHYQGFVRGIRRRLKDKT